MLITDRGVLVRTRVAEIRELGRATQGVTLIALDDGSKLAGLQRIVENDANGDAANDVDADAPADDNEPEGNHDATTALYRPAGRPRALSRRPRRRRRRRWPRHPPRRSSPAKHELVEALGRGAGPGARELGAQRGRAAGAPAAGRRRAGAARQGARRQARGHGQAAAGCGAASTSTRPRRWCASVRRNSVSRTMQASIEEKYTRRRTAARSSPSSSPPTFKKMPADPAARSTQALQRKLVSEMQPTIEAQGARAAGLDDEASSASLRRPPLPRAGARCGRAGHDGQARISGGVQALTHG